MFKKVISLIALIFVFFSAALYTQEAGLQVPLFQTFFENATFLTNPYCIGDINFGDYKAFSTFNVGLRGGLPIGSIVDLGGEIRFISINPDNGNSESGISDLLVVAKHNFDLKTTQVSAGSKITLPIGSEDIGEGNTDFGIFGSVRHPLSEKISLNGILGINFIEFGNDRKTSLMLGAGGIYTVNEKICVIGELNIQTEVDYGILIGGIDYSITENGSIRAGLGVGLDDGAPDISIRAGYLITFE